MKSQIIGVIIYIIVKIFMNTFFNGLEWFTHLYFVSDALVISFLTFPLLKKHTIFCIGFMLSVGALVRRLQIITGIDPYNFGERRFMPFIFLTLGLILAIYIHGNHKYRKIL